MSVTDAGDQPLKKSVGRASGQKVKLTGQVDLTGLDEAAAFLQGQVSDAIWDRTAEVQKERYRDKVRHILLLCGVEPAAWAVKK